MHVDSKLIQIYIICNIYVRTEIINWSFYFTSLTERRKLVFVYVERHVCYPTMMEIIIIILSREIDLP